MEARIIGCDDDQSAVGPGDSSIDKRVSGDIETNMLEGDHGPLAGKGNAQGFFCSYLFIDTPFGYKIFATS